MGNPRRKSKPYPVDGLGWALLTFEEREFLEERNYVIVVAPPDLNTERIARPSDIRHYNTARFELNQLLAAWGGDPIWQASLWAR